MRCPICQYENAAQAKFCNQCGVKLDQPCSRCAAPNSPGSKFCQQCGQPLGEPPNTHAEEKTAGRPLQHTTTPREERRWATLLFADLSGFTGLSEQLDPEDVKALAQRCTN